MNRSVPAAELHELGFVGEGDFVAAVGAVGGGEGDEGVVLEGAGVVVDEVGDGRGVGELGGDCVDEVPEGVVVIGDEAAAHGDEGVEAPDGLAAGGGGSDGGGEQAL